MSNWSTPKENWALDDGALLTDMNRIEGNINFLCNTYQLSGFMNEPGFYLDETLSYPIATIGIVVPNGFSIKILRASYYSSNANHKFRISLYNGVNTTTWTNTNQTSEELPNFVLYSNTTGNNVTVRVTISVYTTVTDTYDVSSGCLIMLSKETTI